MRRALAAAAVASSLALAAPAAAHPGIGLVRDARGNVYYTDLRHVWRVAPDGRVSLAVRDVHSHELALDATGALVGEDSEFLGGDRYRHRVWRLGPDGRVTDVVPWRDGFWRDYGFARARDGTSYVVRCAAVSYCTIQRRTAAGDSADAAPNARFGRGLFSLAAAPDGGVYAADGRDLRRVDARGRVTTVASDLAPPNAPGLFGLWVAPRGDVYAASYGARAVLRVAPDGRTTTVARSPAGWAPTGVLVAPGGDLWILESSTTNEARVRRVATSGAVTVFRAPSRD